MLRLFFISALICSWLNVCADDELFKLKFTNGIELNFLVSDGYLLGIQSASANEISLKSDKTSIFPLIAEDWQTINRIYPLLRLREFKEHPNSAEIICDIFSTTDTIVYYHFFQKKWTNTA